MSGFQPVQVPDFGATLARGQQYGINQLASMAQMRQLQQQEGRDNALVQFAPLLSSPDPTVRMNALSGLARFMPDVALKMMGDERDRAEWTAGMPSAAPVAQAAPPAGGAATPVGGGFFGTLAGLESGGNPNARNPRSSATGTFQFIDGTWLQFAKENPNLFPNMTDAQILAARSNPGLQQQAAEWYAGKNTAALRAAGVEPSAPALALSHRFDGPVAARIIQAPPGTPIAAIVGEAAMRANPDLAGKTTDQVVAQAQQRFATTNVSGGAGGGSGPPALPEVPGFDMARVRQAMAMPNNSLAQKYLESYYKAAQVLLRTETMPRSAERFQQDIQLAQTAAPRNTVTTNVTNAGDRETDKLVSEQWNQLEQGVQQAGRTNVLLDRGARALESFQPGVLAEKRVWLGQVAREFGLRSNASEGEMLRAVQRQLEMAVTPRGQGAITENERALIRDQINILTSTPEAARETMKLVRQLNDYDARIATIYRANARKNGGRPDPVTVREEVAAFVQGNPPPDATAALSPYLTPQEVANTPPPGVPAPGGGTASPPPNIPPPPGGGRIIMPGSR